MFVYFKSNSNWFESHYMKADTERLFPYDIESLENEIRDQVSKRYENTAIFKDRLKTNERTLNESIDFRISEMAMGRMASYMEAEIIHPIITFHGTSLEACTNIIDNGYDIAGLKDSKIKTAHGARYGYGVYTSPFFDFAKLYSTKKPGESKYVLINLVFCGKFKLVPNNSSLVDKSKPVNNKYNDGTDTHIIYGYEQIISADPDRVIPIAIITLS